MRLFLGLVLSCCLSVSHAGSWDDAVPFGSSQARDDAPPTQAASAAAAIDPQAAAAICPAPLAATAPPQTQTDTAAPLPSLKIYPNDDLWQRIRNGFGLAELNDPLVQENEEWYANRPDYTRRMLDRSTRYLHYIVEQVEKRGMPMEIALLPMIESAYNPNAYSRSHASGIWQFIPSTGKHFGLEQSWWYDGRRDIVAATHAALDYLERLYSLFGDWELALAAYNWGEGAVARAQAKNAAQGEPTDYLSLNLPNETRNYVPRLLAIKHLIESPDSFGLNLPKLANAPQLARLQTEQHMDVRVAAKLAEMPVDEFLNLNPAYNQPVLARNGKCNLLLPVNKVDTFKENLAQYDRPLLSWQAYHARRGEKPEQIAHKFGMTVAELEQRNELRLNKRHRLAQDTTLLVPLRQNKLAINTTATLPPETGPDESRPSRNEEKTARLASYTVQKGDTLYGIARRFNVSVDDLKQWNKLGKPALHHGQKLAIAGKADNTRLANDTAIKAGKKTAQHQRHSHKTYTVRRGDTLYSIARRFDVSVVDLARWNNLHSQTASLRPGQKVVIQEA